MRIGLSQILISSLALGSAISMLAQQGSTITEQDSKSQENLKEETPKKSNEKSELCTLEDVGSPLIYPGVGAAYVGGTIPGMYMSSPWRTVLLDPFGGHQLKRKGRMALTSKCLLFAFKGDKNNQGKFQVIDKTMNLSIFSCPKTFSFKNRCGCEDGRDSGEPDAWLMAIPYKPIVVLSRARYSTSDLVSISTGYAVASAGLLAALSQGIKSAHTLELSLGLATPVLAAYYYFGVLRPRVTENYLGVFIREKSDRPEPKETPEGVDKTSVEFQSDRPLASAQKGKLTITKSSDELFKTSDVVMFRIANYHDYYNISAILNARTGLTFVSENAEKPTK